MKRERIWRTHRPSRGFVWLGCPRRCRRRPRGSCTGAPPLRCRRGGGQHFRMFWGLVWPNLNISKRLPGERLERREIGPARFLVLVAASAAAAAAGGKRVPPRWGLGCRHPVRLPEICRPAWTWKRGGGGKKIINCLKYNLVYTLNRTNSRRRLNASPVSDVFCSKSSSSSDSEPQSCSCPPFSKLLRELPSDVWDTPNLVIEAPG